MEDPQHSVDIPGLLSEMRSTAAILRDIMRSAESGIRAFHPAGMADPEGFLAMGCDETLIHGLRHREGSARAVRVATRLVRQGAGPAVPVGAARRERVSDAPMVERPHRAL